MITTKDKMCEEAIGMFRESGYENISINMICGRLGVTRGSFYHHFDSKNALLLYWFASRVKASISLDGSLDSGKQTLRKHALDYARMLAEIGHDLMYHVLTAEFELEGRHFHTYFDEESPSIALIDRAIAEGEIRSDQSGRELIDAFAAAMIGIIVRWKFERGAFDIQQRIESAFDTIYR
ncbi:TetR/AcrR family transcriptional regulator [Saccharibacillus sp. CPCC 101409]|uniref:TetR/AcrR family transcriptional regulator n=1 Tax=Saccharibacillus sp. CPCC 101409 TaxID=3058041 RepID=UPI0026720F41|nr:TetR/AcrR family transcriptional regulator [Saccharibacillus sp. CPCC 101409]MDO3408938.1 TetR/AcrR family transcriptional regulator [Saccharibacillus sp. CPCC 101409]